jgi:predicted nucleic acid-binding protein
MPFIAVLDTNVLFSAPVRDLLLNMADVGLFYPIWSNEILEELTRAISSKKPGVQIDKIRYLIDEMNFAFPDAKTSNHLKLIEELMLPDADDRHVMAAAIHANANIIITFNKKDFPDDYLRKYYIEVFHPDDFISMLFEHHELQIVNAFKNQVSNLRKPPLTQLAVLEKLRICGLSKTVSKLSVVTSK